MACVQDLPDACLVRIFSHLDVMDVMRLSVTCKAMEKSCQDPLLWRQLAVHKWGRHVPPTADRAWSCRRMSCRSIRQSPFQLLQECYPDPWQHIIACVLCSRTSGSQIIRDTVAQFFACFPTPSHVLDAQQQIITQIIHPLGLQPVRLRAVTDISGCFLDSDWTKPSDFYGCGKFVDDSWRIFCKGDLSGKGVEDVNLKRYLQWAKKAGSTEPATHSEDGSNGVDAAVRGAKRQQVVQHTSRVPAAKKDRQQEPPQSGRRMTRSARAAHPEPLQSL